MAASLSVWPPKPGLSLVTVEILAEVQWRERQRAHESTVDTLLAGHLDRARRGVRHPVEDFLFTYYSYRPGQLRRWHPGTGVVLRGLEPETPVVNDKQRTEIRRLREILAATAERPAAFSCFGLHEWAMVYRQQQTAVRHAAVPLRLGSAQTDAVVDSLPMRCTHFDAFRFFTEPARPRNPVQLSRAAQADHEQPGCLHATMDLYRAAYSMVPFTSSELVLECFRLAKDVREVDMRASPYDLSAYGYPPITIETTQGRAEYAVLQRRFAERAAPLRARLLEVASHLDEESGPTGNASTPGG
jgi:hypothetical protein